VNGGQTTLVYAMDISDSRDIHVAAIAQLGERQTEDLKVTGSIPVRGISFAFADAPFLKLIVPP
jgi:hypothetical protein